MNLQEFGNPRALLMDALVSEESMLIDEFE